MEVCVEKENFRDWLKGYVEVGENSIENQQIE